MKPWRRIGPTKNGAIVLPKECGEFVLSLPATYNVEIQSVGVTFTKILAVYGVSSETVGTTSIQGFNRGSFWDLVVAKNLGGGEPNEVGTCGKPAPILTEAENLIVVLVRTVDGISTDNVLTGMWR